MNGEGTMYTLSIYDDGDMALHEEGVRSTERWAPAGTVLPEKFMAIYHTMIMMPDDTECVIDGYRAVAGISYDCNYKWVQIDHIESVEGQQLCQLFTEERPQYEY